MVPVCPIDLTAPTLTKRSQISPQSKGSAQRPKNDRSIFATPESAIADLLRNCPTSALGDYCERTAFHLLVIDAPALSPNHLELCLSSLSAVPAQGL